MIPRVGTLSVQNALAELVQLADEARANLGLGPLSSVQGADTLAATISALGYAPAPDTSPVFHDSMTLPTWSSSTRPQNPRVGMMGYSSDLGMPEIFTGSVWVHAGNADDEILDGGNF